MTQRQMADIVRRQLALDCCCEPEDFEKEGTLYFALGNSPGRRPFPRGATHLEITTAGNAVIVSATSDILPYVREQLDGKSRDEAFSMPFIYGHSMYYMPDLSRFAPARTPEGYQIAWAERSEIPQLYGTEGFRNALMYEEDHPRPDVLAVIASRHGEIVGMAGASEDCATMWQVGIDVLPPCRGQGLAAALVSMLTQEVMRRGKIPYYGTASSNIASQRVAHRCGYAPAWMCSYQSRFDSAGAQPARQHTFKAIC